MDALRGEPGVTRWDWHRARQLCLRETQRVLGTGPASEDAAQEAVLRAWRQRDRCHDPQRPGPWLRRIAHTEALRIAALPCDAALETLAEPEWREQVADPGEDPASELVDRLLT